MRNWKPGPDPFGLVQDTLIPAITEVGARYERREYFLPQLIRAAETMADGFRRSQAAAGGRAGPGSASGSGNGNG